MIYYTDYVCMRACVRACVRVSVRVCVCVCVCEQHLYENAGSDSYPMCRICFYNFHALSIQERPSHAKQVACCYPSL